MKSRRIAQTDREIPHIVENNTIYTKEVDKLTKIGQNLQKTNVMNRNMAEEEITNLVETSVENFINIQYAIDENQLPSPNEIDKIIKKLRPYKAPGEDKIQAVVLKKLPRKMTIQIYYTSIYNACFRKKYFPNIWKKTNIIPIKKGLERP